jgi:hypothetical protein
MSTHASRSLRGLPFGVARSSSESLARARRVSNSSVSLSAGTRAAPPASGDAPIMRKRELRREFGADLPGVIGLSISDADGEAGGGAIVIVGRGGCVSGGVAGGFVAVTESAMGGGSGGTGGAGEDGEADGLSIRLIVLWWREGVTRRVALGLSRSSRSKSTSRLLGGAGTRPGV